MFKNLVNAMHPHSTACFAAFELTSFIHEFSGCVGRYSLFSHTLKGLSTHEFFLPAHNVLSYKKGKNCIDTDRFQLSY